MGIPLKETIPKVIPGYVDKARGAAQIAAERGFVGLDGLIQNGKKHSMKLCWMQISKNIGNFDK